MTWHWLKLQAFRLLEITNRAYILYIKDYSSMWDQDEMALSNTQSVINLFQSSAIRNIAYNVQKHKFKTIGSFRNRMRNR